MKVAIFGGTFNPPHFGHLFFANEVRQKLEYDKIIFVPSAISAHKEKDENTNDIDRLNMIKLSVESYPWAIVSECDLSRGGITRTVDTLKDIKKEYALDDKPGFIIGNDLIDGFHLWKNSEEIVQLADLIVGSREFNNFKFKYNHCVVNNRVFPLSSSEIRSRVGKGFDIDFLLPNKVVEYIKNNELYKTNS